MKRRKLVYAAAGIVFAELLFAALWRSPPNTRPDRVEATVDWQLPALPEAFDATSALTLLAESPVWGEQQLAASEETTQPSWRLVGISTGGGQKTALISIDGEPIQALTVGQRLPEGGEIIDIRADGIGVEIDGKLQRLPVNDPEPQAW